MAVRDFMSTKVVYVSPDTTVAHATDIMREQGLRRLPVIENDKLVGLVTESSIADASPSKATSLSIFEMNYLLNKTKIRDIMIKDVITVSKFASLEDAIYLMMKNSIAVLVVVDDEQVSGIITDRDIYRAFLQISGYGERGVRLNLLASDEVGVLETIIHTITEENLNIRSIMSVQRKSGKVAIEVQIERDDFDTEKLRQSLEAKGFEIESLEKTSPKVGF
ncbi:CBS domain-containing protein [Streptococcus loxodontisalivarius]|uniref:Acetoin utilization protein AcuB n=1 Tax=Streptococcus loxodontisalivarius TaxID=1349415 RepID=A0ABS2PV57_9STRE|nr:CBS domain-containing protein [Streptococcus loxodontisalivarius]MBM7643600.1 acetoin utilization protein AcuB [Streptococcus loxodontisalivarius]